MTSRCAIQLWTWRELSPEPCKLCLERVKELAGKVSVGTYLSALGEVESLEGVEPFARIAEQVSNRSMTMVGVNSSGEPIYQMGAWKRREAVPSIYWRCPVHRPQRR